MDGGQLFWGPRSGVLAVIVVAVVTVEGGCEGGVGSRNLPDTTAAHDMTQDRWRATTRGAEGGERKGGGRGGTRREGCAIACREGGGGGVRGLGGFEESRGWGRVGGKGKGKEEGRRKKEERREKEREGKGCGRGGGLWTAPGGVEAKIVGKE